MVLLNSVRVLWTVYMCFQGFQNVLKKASYLAKVGDNGKFIKGQKVVILTRVTGEKLSSSQKKSCGHQLLTKSLVL